MKKNLIFLFLFVILLAHNVKAVGVISDLLPDTVFYFKPEQELNFGFLAFSNTDKVMDHELSLGGDLAEYAMLSTHVIKDLEPGKTEGFSVNLKMPQSLDAGLHTLYVCVGETQARGAVAEGAAIGTKTVACATVKVFSLYPYPFADFSLNVKNVALGEKANFVLDVSSLSLLDMNIRADIDIYNKANPNKIVTLKTQQKRLRSSEKAQLSAELDTANFEIGEYLARATLFFDGTNATKEASFRIGELSIEILNFTEEVEKGKIEPIEIWVKSNWNHKIDNIYATVNISKENFTLIINTPTESVEAWQSKPLVAYWNTQNIKAENYNVKITLHYEDKITEKDGIIKVITKIRLMTLILLIAVAVLVIMLIIMIIKTKKQKHRKKAKA